MEKGHSCVKRKKKVGHLRQEKFPCLFFVFLPKGFSLTLVKTLKGSLPNDVVYAVCTLPFCVPISDDFVVCLVFVRDCICFAGNKHIEKYIICM